MLDIGNYGHVWKNSVLLICKCEVRCAMHRSCCHLLSGLNLAKLTRLLRPVLAKLDATKKVSSQVSLIALCTSYLSHPSSPQRRGSPPPKSSRTSRLWLMAGHSPFPLPCPPLTLDTSPVWCEDTGVPLLHSATGLSSSWNRGCSSRDLESGYYHHHHPPPTALLTPPPIWPTKYGQIKKQPTAAYQLLPPTDQELLPLTYIRRRPFHEKLSLILFNRLCVTVP